MFECFIFRLVLPENPIFPSGKCCVCVIFSLYPPAKVSHLYFLIKPSTPSITCARCLCLCGKRLCAGAGLWSCVTTALCGDRFVMFQGLWMKLSCVAKAFRPQGGPCGGAAFSPRRALLRLPPPRSPPRLSWEARGRLRRDTGLCAAPSQVGRDPPDVGGLAPPWCQSLGFSPPDVASEPGPPPACCEGGSSLCRHPLIKLRL